MRILLQPAHLLLALSVWSFRNQVLSFSSPKQVPQRASTVATPGIGASTKLASTPNYYSTSTSSNKQKTVHKDVVIIGGGLAGLSAAFYLIQMDPTRHISILDKDPQLQAPSGSFAAAGMLAPNSERLPPGDLLDLCCASRNMFPAFCQEVQQAADCTTVGYVASGGFLAPAFAGDAVATWAPLNEQQAIWLDAIQVRELEPQLHPKVVGGWWFPEDASVDARLLTLALQTACINLGVDYKNGHTVQSLDLREGTCHGLWLESGKYIACKSALVANGAWMRQLLPVPLEPHKGQSLSLRMPPNQPPLLKRVLFAADTYIVPKADGRIVVGATVEAGSYDANVNPAGIMHVLHHALQLVPGLADLPLEETWAGLRPTTPDKGPILGATPWKNLFLAGGYWRNGVLLAPKTGELIAALMTGKNLAPQDADFLKAFGWDRFTSPEGGRRLAASARYAASIHPVHTRKSGAGIAAAVGTELGALSTAKSAGEERAKDRASLWGNEDDVFEQAANMGRQDGAAFSFERDDIKVTDESQPSAELSQDAAGATSQPVAQQDKPAHTDSITKSDLSSIYDAIRSNKAKEEVELEGDAEEERPDPGFRIYYIDEQTGVHHEIPPYTSPGGFHAGLDASRGTATEAAPARKSIDGSTYDGYTKIQEAAAAEPDDVKETMREMRIRNRAESMGRLDIDEASFERSRGVNGDEARKPSENPKNKTVEKGDLSSIYDKIGSNKASVTRELMEPNGDERPDPGFRIYHVDEETGEHHAVPPYTSPGEFLEQLAESKRESTREPEAKLDGALLNGTSKPATTSSPGQKRDDGFTETTFDGYQDIIKANSAADRQDELKSMREARKRNRIGSETIDEAELHL